MIGYGVCCGWWDKLHRHVTPRITGRPLMVLSGQTSIATAYNSILDAYAPWDLDAVVLLHDDLEVTDPDAEAKTLAALDEDVALVGVAGGGDGTTLAWWDTAMVGHQLIDTGLVDFGARTGDVTLIEGSYMAFSPWAVRNLRFDITFPGFHGYDEIAMTARSLGKRVVVADIDTHHHTTLGYSSDASRDQWQHCDDLFRAKWTSPGLRVNLGCGDRYAEGWVNVDHAGSPGRKDRTVDLTGPLPWAPGSIAAVYAGHVLEHLTIPDALSLLERIRTCVRTGGEVMVVGPDLTRAVAMAQAGTLDVTLDSLRHGASRWAGDEHRWECHASILADMLKEAGWVDVAEVAIGDVPASWPVADRRPVWQCALSAVAP